MAASRALGLTHALILGIAISAAACAPAGPVAGEREGRASSAVVGGAADDQAPEANVVVALERPGSGADQCTGTLLTPTVVVTAAACVTPMRAGLRPTVRVGASKMAARRYNAASDAVTLKGATSDARGDVALVFLDPRTPVVEGVRIAHPTLERPSDDAALDGAGVAGWSPLASEGRPRADVSTRQIYRYPETLFSVDWGMSEDDAPYWFRDVAGAAGRLLDVDLGGPLFVEVNGERQILGVSTLLAANHGQFAPCPAGGGSCDAWRDVTFGATAEALRARLSLPRNEASESWYAMHPLAGGRTDWWRGEVDYFGACQTTLDADCDHWMDDSAALGLAASPRDNCPDAPNPDQSDRDGDGVGDACDPCPDLAVSGDRCTASLQVGAKLTAAKAALASATSLRARVTCTEPQRVALAAQIATLATTLIQMRDDVESEAWALIDSRPYFATPNAVQAPVPSVYAAYDAYAAADVAIDDIARLVKALDMDAGLIAQATPSSCYDPDPSTPNLKVWGLHQQNHYAGNGDHFVADVNGDGKADHVWFVDRKVAVGLSTGTRFADDTLWMEGNGPTREFPGRGLWRDQYLTPRDVGDVNGDGKADLVSFASDGVYVFLSTGTSFEPAGVWNEDFNAASAVWSNSDSNPRMLADVNGDHLADIVGFADDGVYVSLSTGTAFAPKVRWTTDFGGSPASGGWTSAGGMPRAFGDVNGDGKADLVGLFTDQKVWVSLSTGSAFAPRKLYYDTWWPTRSGELLVGDTNGDRMADLVAYEENANFMVSVSMGASTASPFFKPSDFVFDNDTPIRDGEDHDLIRVAVGDVDGDGLVEFVAFESNYVVVAPARQGGASAR